MFKHKVISALREILRKNGGEYTEKPFVLAVSGGVDSLSLAHVLRDSGLGLVVAHLDHGLRPVSARQASLLGQLMQEWGLPFVSRRVDVAAFAREQKMGIEEAARVCRYRFLFEAAADCGAQGIVLAHNADDQVETVLMHFMRGTGMAGLTGMYPCVYLKQFDDIIPLLRPLLGVKRKEIEDYARENGLCPLEDETNQETLYYRNYLRLQLIPTLEELNPGFKQSVARMAEVMRGDEQLLLQLEAQAFRECVLLDSDDELILKRDVLLGLDIALQRRVIRRCLNQLRPVNPDFGFLDIEKSRALMMKGQGRQDLSSGLSGIIVGDHFHFLNQGARPTIINYPQWCERAAPGFLNVGDTMDLNDGWRLQARMIDAKAYAGIPDTEKQDPKQAFIHPMGLKWPLIVRTPQRGERWSPLGMESGSQKLSDFFVNNKIPQPARAGWPAVLSGESMIWLVGLRVAQPWRLLGDELEILHLSLTQA